MKFKLRTEYGLLCMVYIAKHSAETKWISIKEMAVKEHYPLAFIEKTLQALKKSGLLVSQQGNHGGYALARPAAEITMREIVDTLEGGTFDIFCKSGVAEDIVCTHFCLCGVKPVWRKTKQLLDEFYGSITLDMLTKNEIEVRQLMPHKEEAHS